MFLLPRNPDKTRREAPPPRRRRSAIFGNNTIAQSSRVMNVNVKYKLTIPHRNLHRLGRTVSCYASVAKQTHRPDHFLTIAALASSLYLARGRLHQQELAIASKFDCRISSTVLTQSASDSEFMRTVAPAAPSFLSDCTPNSSSATGNECGFALENQIGSSITKTTPFFPSARRLENISK